MRKNYQPKKRARCHEVFLVVSKGGHIILQNIKIGVGRRGWHLRSEPRQQGQRVLLNSAYVTLSFRDATGEKE
jgi:hypothetical protein